MDDGHHPLAAGEFDRVFYHSKNEWLMSVKL